MGEQLHEWLSVAILYGQQYPGTLLVIGVVLVLLAIRHYQAKYRPGDQIQREFRKVGIYPSEQQEETLRSDFARIAAESARKGLEERLKHQAAVQRDKDQVARVAEISNAHVVVIRDLGSTLQALELEYLKYRKSLASEQAKEAMRLLVEKAVAQITEIADTSAATLPPFTISDGKAVEGKGAETKAEGGKEAARQRSALKIEMPVKLNSMKLNGQHATAVNGDVVHY
ncbi:MAG: hypothetical protein U0350_02090 [Caldilineaceae bacterium]